MQKGVKCAKPCQGEDEGEGPIKAHIFCARFKILVVPEYLQRSSRKLNSPVDGRRNGRVIPKGGVVLCQGR